MLTSYWLNPVIGRIGASQKLIGLVYGLDLIEFALIHLVFAHLIRHKGFFWLSDGITARLNRITGVLQTYYAI